MAPMPMTAPGRSGITTVTGRPSTVVARAVVTGQIRHDPLMRSIRAWAGATEG